MEIASTGYDLIVFQVWRPLTNCSFQLMGSHRIEGYVVGEDYLVDTASISPSLPPLPVAPGDIMGIYVVEGNSMAASVQQYLDGNTTVYVSAVSTKAFSGLSMLDHCGAGDGSAEAAGAPIITARIVQSK